MKLLGYELNKLLLNRKMWIAVLLLFVVKILLLLYTPGDGTYSQINKSIYRRYMEQYQGELTAEKAEQIEAENTRLNETLALESEMKEKYFAGEIDADTYDAYQTELYDAQAKQPTFEKVYEKYQYFLAQGDSFPASPQFFYDLDWDKYLKGMFIDIPLLLALLVVIAPAFAMEFSSGAFQILLSSRRGRGRTYWAKVAASLVYAVCVSALFFGADMLLNVQRYRLPGWDAPLQSIQTFSGCPYALTMRTYFWSVYLYRFLFMLGIAVLIVTLSALMKRMIAICFASAFLVMAPMALQGIAPVFSDLSYGVQAGGFEAFASYHTLSGVGNLVISIVFLVLLSLLLLFWGRFSYAPASQRG